MSASSPVSSLPDNPLVSVVMPAYNAAAYLPDALRSITSQTHTNWELIIVDDGSTDSTAAILESFRDARARIIRHERNRGLSASYNEAIRAAQGPLVARMDADDVMFPDRLARQVAFLQTHLDTGIVGSAVLLMDADGRHRSIAVRPETHLQIKWTALWSTPLYHPTIMARAELLRRHPYDESLVRSEDYELWSRILFTTDVRMANLSEPLLKHRVHTGSFTQSGRRERAEASARNTVANLQRYLRLTDTQKAALRARKGGSRMTLRHTLALRRLATTAADAFIVRERPDGPDARWIRARADALRRDAIRSWFRGMLRSIT